MKRIYMTLATIAAFSMSAFAQAQVDLSAYVVTDPVDGKAIGPNQELKRSAEEGGPFDVILAIGMQDGLDPIPGGDFMWYVTPFVDSGFMSGVGYQDDIYYDPDQDGGLGMILFNIPNANMTGAGHTAANVVSSDSIKTLIDWDLYNSLDSIHVVYPPFEVGKSYGFFMQVRRVGFVTEGSVTYTTEDPNLADNFDAVRIVWSEGVNIADLFPAKENKQISIYPNPASSEVNFNFDYSAPSHAKAAIRDVTGRMVMTKNFGRALPGTQKYTIDVSSLSPGSYTLEFDTDEAKAVSKFTISK